MAKAASKRGIARAPIRELMKSVGAQIVEKSAVTEMKAQLEDAIKACTTNALKLTRHSKHTKVSRDDIDLAMKMGKCF